MKPIKIIRNSRFCLIVIALLILPSFTLAEVNLHDKGIRAYTKRDYKTAVKYFKEYIKEKPDARTYYLLGYALYKMKKYPESFKYFKEAYILDPNISPVTH